jgi:hypothetical protein
MMMWQALPFSDAGSVGFYSAAAAFFNVGWAFVQINHMVLIPGTRVLFRRPQCHLRDPGFVVMMMVTMLGPRMIMLVLL